MPIKTKLFRKLLFAVTLFGFSLETQAQLNDPLSVEQLSRMLQAAPMWGVRGYKEFPTQLAVSGSMTFSTNDIDTLFWVAGMDTAKTRSYRAMTSLNIVKSGEDWAPKGTNPSGYHFDVPYFVNINGGTWVTSAHKMVVPGLAKYKNTAIQAPPVATPNHFAQKSGWTWVYEYTRRSGDRMFSSSTLAKLWLTLKTYRESGSQFSSTWSVSLSSQSSSARLIPPESSSESNNSWTDTNVTVNGSIDSGMRFDDFLPQAYKTGQRTPPLFLNHCKLPAIMSENPSPRFTSMVNTMKPPYYVYWQFSNSEVVMSVYKDSVGFIGLTTETPLEGSYSMSLPLVYFGTNPPERPVNLAQKASSHRVRRAKVDAMPGLGSFQLQNQNPSRRDEDFVDGLGRERP